MKQLLQHGIPDTRWILTDGVRRLIGVGSADRRCRRPIVTSHWTRTGVLQKLGEPIRGQVLVLFALMLGLVFLSVLAAAADVSHMHIERRKLQNAADSAVLAAAEEYKVSQNSAASTAAARGSVERNAPYVTDFTVVGSGTGLQNGIQFSGESVRVALRYEFEGFFSGAIGLPTLDVGARARALISPPEVYLPITVKRFDEGRTDLPLDSPLQPDPAGAQTRNQRTDYLCGGTGQITEWPSPYGIPPAQLQSANCSTPPSPTNPGPEGYLVGSGVRPNAPSAVGESIRGWVVPEIRNWHTGSPTCYHNFSCTVNTAKNEVADYVAKFGGTSTDDAMPAPAVGESVGMITGTSAGLTVKSVQARYAVGDKVLAMVWAGTVYASSSGNRYVFIVGYAQFTITAIDANSIKVRAVSGIKSSPIQLMDQRLTSLSAWE
ncbi:MAG: pilus assembly protein TadG-related protein [Chloroflexota bacterium]|nr:pilus assembly protein TadG-related protein [Chloroflexota bacterium]